MTGENSKHQVTTLWVQKRLTLIALTSLGLLFFVDHWAAAVIIGLLALFLSFAVLDAQDMVAPSDELE